MLSECRSADAETLAPTVDFLSPKDYHYLLYGLSDLIEANDTLLKFDEMPQVCMWLRLSTCQGKHWLLPSSCQAPTMRVIHTTRLNGCLSDIAVTGTAHRICIVFTTHDEMTSGGLYPIFDHLAALGRKHLNRGESGCALFFQEVARRNIMLADRTATGNCIGPPYVAPVLIES